MWVNYSFEEIWQRHFLSHCGLTEALHAIGSFWLQLKKAVKWLNTIPVSSSLDLLLHLSSSYCPCPIIFPCGEIQPSCSSITDKWQNKRLQRQSLYCQLNSAHEWNTLKHTETTLWRDTESRQWPKRPLAWGKSIMNNGDWDWSPLYPARMPDISVFYEFSSSAHYPALELVKPSGGKNLIRMNIFPRKLAGFWETMRIRTSGTSRNRVFSPDIMQDSSHMSDNKWI